MKFDGALASTTNLVDAVRDVVILDERMVGGIIEDERVMFQSVVDPFAQFLLADDGSCRVVWVAEIDDIDMPFWRCRHEAVLSSARHVNDARPSSVLLCSRASRHDVRVNIDGIDRVSHTDGVIPPQ